MKLRLSMWTLLFVTLFSHSSIGDNLRCIGNDGGTPFYNISQDVSSKQIIVSSKGLIRDFVYHEKLDQIVYRNIENEVRTLNLKNSNDHFISYTGKKFSRVIEEDLGRILKVDTTHYLDTAIDPVWYQYGQPNRVMEHLFSEKGDIFSLESFWQDKGNLLSSGKYHFSFLTHESNTLWRRQCVASANIGANLKIAKGNLFPFIYFYVIKKGLVESKVIVYRMAVNQVKGNGNCPIEEVTQYDYSNLGPIKAFYYFNVDNRNAFAFHLSDPNRNLFWDKPGECAYYNFKGKTPIFISPKHPVFATWKNGEGLSLHNLKDKTELRFFGNMSQSQFGTENLWIANEGKTFYSSLATSHDQGGRLIVKTDLE